MLHDTNWQIDRLKKVQAEVEHQILCTPSSPKREKLTDANIHAMAAIAALEESKNAPQQY